MNSRVAIGTLVFTMVGCAGPQSDSVQVDLAQFREFVGPRKLGTVAAVGLQLPAFSPDGREFLYLRADGPVAPQMLLGESDGDNTPNAASLSIWLRPAVGMGQGRAFSRGGSAHSPVWSESGRAILYVLNESVGSRIVHVDRDRATETILGVEGAVNLFARFDGDESTVVFCAGRDAAGPFRVYRQRVDETEPTPLTPEGLDCVLPIGIDESGRLLCGQVIGDSLHWVSADANGVTIWLPDCGPGDRLSLSNVWAGVSAPLSANRQDLLFFDALRGQVRVWQRAERRVSGFMAGSIAACWLTDGVLALAGENEWRIVGTDGVIRMSLRGSSWIPRRYVPSERRLILLGRDRGSRLAIHELTFVTAGDGPADRGGDTAAE